jgi:transcriptional regulator with XRE-family HTH domain
LREKAVTAVAEANPTVARRKLAVYFRDLRERHELGLDKLSAILGVAPSQASRLDTGARGFQVDDVQKLATWYGLEEAELARLVALAEEGRKRAWWQQLEIAPALRTMIGMEQAAVSIGEYAGSVIPGLLQIPDYARAATAAGAIDVPEQKIIEVVRVRVRRQQILARERRPELWTVIDESVLARVAGGASVMRSQLEHLHAKAKEPGITVQVIGFEYGLYPGAGGNHFLLLQMGDDLPDVLYEESLQKNSDTTDRGRLQVARKLWDTMRALALSPRDSAERIKQYIDRLPE